MALSSEYKFSADQPQSDPKDDVFGYARTAQDLVDIIKDVDALNGYVISLNGMWGTGKTTILNFVEFIIEHENNSNKPIIVKFSPWLFSGHEELLHHFFDQLQIILKKKTVFAAKAFKKVNQYAEAISELPVDKLLQGVALLHGIPIPEISKTIARFTKRNKKDVTELKSEVEDELKKLNKKILVIIDDIDRLTPDEILQLFRVIKSVANFPNIVYLLAFDKTTVAKAISNNYINGEAYLEKIVQLSRPVPLPDKTALLELFEKHFFKIVEDTPFLNEHGNIVFWHAIWPLIEKPRDIYVFLNSLSISYENLKGEVNIADLCAIELLRIFHNDNYNFIKENGEWYFGGLSTDFFTSNNSEKSRFTEFHTLHTENLPRKVKRLLKTIFPKLNAIGEFASRNEEFYTSNQAEWRNEKRICSPEYFEMYFQLDVPLDAISEREFLEIIELSNEKEKFKKRLNELQSQKRSDGFSKLSVLLNLISDRAKTPVIKSKSESLIQSLLFESDEFSEEIEPVGFAQMKRNYETLSYIVIQLLENIDKSQRFNLLAELSTDKLSIVTFARTINALQWEHDDNNQQDTTISLDELNSLKDIVLENIRNMAEKGDLLSTVPDLYLILLLWKSWASFDEMKSWIDRIIVDDENLVIFLRKNLGLGWNSVQGGVYRIDYGYISEILNIPQTAERLERLNSEENLTGLYKVAARIITNLNKSPRIDSFPITEVRKI